MTPETLIAAVPEPVQQEICAAYAHDPINWFRRPSIRFWRTAMLRVLASRGFNVNPSQFIVLVEQALNLR